MKTKKPTYKIPPESDCRILVLSTRHMSQDDNELLKSESRDEDVLVPTLLADAAEGGWYIHISDDADEQASDAISDELKATIFTARRLGYQYLRFDCDAPVIKNFPIGKWS